jgi:Fic family protein
MHMVIRTPALSSRDEDVIAKVDIAREELALWLRTPRRWTGLLRRSTLGRAIRASNSIEGYVIPKDDVVAAAEGEAVDATEDTQRATEGYRRAMTHVLGLATDPTFEWSAAVIKALHYMMLEHHLDKLPGQWRNGPVYVVDEKDRTVYEGPEFARVPSLMAEFVDNLSAGTAAVPGIVRGAMAHLNMAMIHPFKDGNGRMARCLQTLVLARSGALDPIFSSIEEYLGRNTGPYYDILADVGHGRWRPDADAHPWLRFCLRAHFYQAQTFLRRTREAETVMNALEGEVTRRGLPERTKLALWDAATGYKVKNNTYRAAAEISHGLASKDLMALAGSGLLVPIGERKGRYYLASPRLQDIRRNAAENRFIANPYEENAKTTVAAATAIAATPAGPLGFTISSPPSSSTGPTPPSVQAERAPRPKQA